MIPIVQKIQYLMKSVEETINLSYSHFLFDSCYKIQCIVSRGNIWHRSILKLHLRI